MTSIIIFTVTPSLISGETNKLKVTFRNSGKTDLKVNLIVGSVSESDDFSNVIRNVSVVVDYRAIGPPNDTLIHIGTSLSSTIHGYQTDDFDILLSCKRFCTAS